MSYQRQRSQDLLRNDAVQDSLRVTGQRIVDVGLLHLSAIRSVLAAYRSTEVHVTEKQIQAAWAEYESLRAALQVDDNSDTEGGYRA